MRHWFPCACGHKVLGVKCALSQPLGSANNDAVFTVFRENKHNKTPCAVSRPTPQSEVRNGPSPIHVNATKCSDVFVQCGIKGQSLLNCWSRWNLASHAEMKHLAPLKTMKPDVVMYEFPESASPRWMNQGQMLCQNIQSVGHPGTDTGVVAGQNWQSQQNRCSLVDTCFSKTKTWRAAQLHKMLDDTCSVIFLGDVWCQPVRFHIKCTIRSFVFRACVLPHKAHSTSFIES